MRHVSPVGERLQSLRNVLPAPWVKAATIVVHQQDDIPERDAKAEHMSLTPWRVPEVHQPLGSINRARLQIYLEMAAFRRALNGERAQRSTSTVSAL